MDVRDRQKQPDVALVVVIDKSGSMDACHCNVANRDLGVAIQGIPKVDIGKEAILRAAAAMTARDELGVVAFDEAAHWVVDARPLGDIGEPAGGGAPTPSSQARATRAGGRFSPAPNPAAIPDIFLKETEQVAGQQIIEEAFFPIQTSSSPILRGLDQGFPQLLGYNGTTIKSAAQQVLATARDDPLLAQWQYGLGGSGGGRSRPRALL